MTSRSRRTLAWLHAWGGLTIGLAAVMLAVTGAGLVVRPQLAALMDHDLLVVPRCATPLPLDALTRSARAAHPGDVLDEIEVRADPTASVAVWFSNKDAVYLDPCSGAALGTRNQYGGLLGTLDWLHRFRFMDLSVGRPLAGWLTVGYAGLLIVGGLVLWWPRAGVSLRSASRFDPRLPGLARTLSLHKILGLYTSVVLMLVVVTALPISFGPIKQALYDATGYVEPEAPSSEVRPGGRRLPMQAAWLSARALVPGANWMSLTYPARPDDAVRIELREPDSPHVNAKSYVYLDAYTGDILAARRYATDTPIGRKAYLYCIALHAALVGGLPYQLLLLVCALAIPAQAYSGFSPFLRRRARSRAPKTLSLIVARKLVEAEGICSFELADPRGRPLPPFSAGAHVDVHLANGMIRQYSLCNDPAETHRYVIAVLRDPESRGGSTLLHDAVEVGTPLRVGLPKNHFPLAESARRSVLVAGGIGVTPLLCMAERLGRLGAEFTLHYCVRSPAHAAFAGRIAGSAFADRVRVHHSSLGQRLDVGALLDACDPGTHVYVCGPARLMDAVAGAAHDRGWPDARVHREFFAAVQRDTGDDVAFDVHLRRSDRTVHVPVGKSVVEALAETGTLVPTACSEGVCGTCLTAVVAGEVDHRDLILGPEERARNDRFTPCCSRARARLVIDL